MKHSIPVIQENIKKYGFSNKFDTVVALETVDNDADVSALDLVREEIKKAIERDYVEAIVLGIKEADKWSKKLSEEFKIPVVTGLPSAIKLVEAVTPLHVTYNKNDDGSQKESRVGL